MRVLTAIVMMWPAVALPGSGGPATVIDAETIEVGGKRFRLFGIDAPEPDQTCRFGDKFVPCGRIAETALMDLTAGATVACEPVEGSGEPPAARCYADDYDLSEGMVYTGWAMADRTEGGRYLTLEKGAADARRGVWRTEFVMPWEWRAGKRLPE